MLYDLVESLPIRYVLEEATVETLEGSTTYIPHEIIIVPGPPTNPLIPAGSISMSKLIYSIAVVMIGDVDVEVGGMTLVKDATGKQKAMEYVKYVWEQTAAIRAADPSGAVHFRAWYEPADPVASAHVQVKVNGGTNFYMDENGVLCFDGPAIIEATPQRPQNELLSLAAESEDEPAVQGTLYVQAGDEEPKAYQITVVEPHQCAGDHWEVQVPATETTVGYRTKQCDICDEIIAVEKMESCGDHSFTPYVLEVAPEAELLGIQTRTCTKCGVLEYRLVNETLVSDLSELLTDASGTLVRQSGKQYLVLESGTTADGLLETLKHADLFYRMDDAGLVQDDAILKTGQKLMADGIGGSLVLVVPGDLDGDGAVTEQDRTKALRMSLYGVSGAAEAVLAADLDRNRKLTLQEVGQVMLASAEVPEDAAYRFFLGAYDGEGKLQQISIAEMDCEQTAAQYLTKLDWTQVKLFLLDQTTSAPLTGYAVCPKR